MNVHSLPETQAESSLIIPSGDKRARIIATTIRLIAEYGFHGAPIAMIAQEAEVGAGTIYRYFQDKDTLILEVFRQVDEALKKVLLHEYSVQQPIRERFLHLCRGIFRYGLQNPYEFKFMEQFYNSPYGANRRRENRFCKCDDTCQDQPLEQVFIIGQAQQVIKPLPLAVLIALAIGPIVFLVKDSLAGMISLDETIIDSTLSACWDAVRETAGDMKGPTGS